MVLAAGCTPRLDTQYASPTGKSINGINTFVDYLKKEGRKVDVWPVLSPKMSTKYGTIVVLLSSYDRIDEKETRDLKELLERGTVHQLMIVVRDSDLAIDYWSQIGKLPELSKSEKEDVDSEYNKERTSFTSDSNHEFDAVQGTWYGLKKVDRSKETPIRTIDCSNEDGRVGTSFEVRWPLERRLESKPEARAIWKSGSDSLLTIEETRGKKVFVLASATPLLNGGLVDPGNRRLAEEFSKLIPETDRVAVSTSSVWHDGSAIESPDILKFMMVHPNGWVFGQSILALLLFCWWKFPIFGRPRQTQNQETARFGRHVEALGILLHRTHDLEFARKRIRDWLGHQKSKSGDHSSSE
ncbi:MAG: DUF4350 domain-containing protein [Planctomycetes bacterium]|nr:DUF4350 domain-containing protein [Planctomycetota bacterium]